MDRGLQSYFEQGAASCTTKNNRRAISRHALLILSSGFCPIAQRIWRKSYIRTQVMLLGTSGIDAVMVTAFGRAAFLLAAAVATGDLSAAEPLAQPPGLVREATTVPFTP